jgi:hypothetical protein
MIGNLIGNLFQALFRRKSHSFFLWAGFQELMGPATGGVLDKGDFRAVTSISIFIRGSKRPAEIMVAAGRISPKYRRRTGQQGSKSSTLGRI